MMKGFAGLRLGLKFGRCVLMNNLVVLRKQQSGETRGDPWPQMGRYHISRFPSLGVGTSRGFGRGGEIYDIGRQHVYMVAITKE